MSSAADLSFNRGAADLLRQYARLLGSLVIFAQNELPEDVAA